MMIKELRYYFLISICLLSTFSSSQVILTEKDYLDQVKKFHPEVVKSQLILSNAKAELKSAKSVFDPDVNLYLDDKQLKSQNYFSHNEASIKLNTRTPFSFSSGYTDNRGVLINPETTSGFITYFGVNFPLLKGLMIDERRAELSKAKININQSLNEQKLIINALLFEASNNYSLWLNAYYKLNLTNQYLDIIRQRIRLNNIMFQNGDKSVADTLEMYTQLQTFKIQQQIALMEFVSNSIKLSSLLWNENGEPYLLADEYIPDTLSIKNLLSLDLNTDFITTNSPFINYYKYKLDQLEIDEKLKKQSLLPMLDINSKYFSADRSVPLNVSSYSLNNNYFVGLNFKYPIFNRSAKANLELVRIKIRENNLNRNQKSWELNTNALEIINEWNRTKNQIIELESLRDNFASLLNIEELKFREGESSIFLINSRESKLIDTDLKSIDTHLKLNLLYNKYKWVNAEYIQ